MNVSKIFCIVLFSSFLAYSAAHRFIHGRPKGGFLGSPGDDHRMGSIKPSTFVATYWFTQKVDHFNSTDTRTFSQKYYKSDTYYREGGPLFILIGGEGAIGASWMIGGAWMKYAQRYNAYCVQLERRFYGDSQPFNDVSTENLKYLTVKQALADLADFIENFNGWYTFSQVIAFGGSYSGSLAAWLRLKYPHIVDGAVASSAPVNIMFNYKGYLESVDSALRYYYPNGDCNDAIKQATAAIKENLKTQTGRQYLKSLFKLCHDIDPNNAKDVSLLFGELAYNFKTVTQYNKDNILSDISDFTVAELCGTMTGIYYGDPIDRYAEVNSQLLHAQSYTCVNHIYSSFINDVKNTYLTSDSVVAGERQWTYQTCTELGGFQSTDSPDQPFGDELPIDYWAQECEDIFGTQFSAANVEARVERFAADFGGLTTNASRIIFINGNIDPWHKMGVLNNVGPENKVIYIDGTAHCADMYTYSYDDLFELTEARNTISDTLGTWLQFTESSTEGPSTPMTTTSHSSPAYFPSPYILGLLTFIALAYNYRN